MCDITISRGSGRGKTASEVPQSTCIYFEKFSLKSASKVTKTSPCTNRPVECPTCKRIFWSYNMYSHYKENHPDYGKDNCLISEEERNLLL